MTITALSTVSQQSSCQGVCQSVLCVPECFTRKSRSRQAQEPCPAFLSLLQLIPGRSGPRSLVQLPRGSGRVPSIQGASKRSYKAQESFPVPRDVPRRSTWPDGPPAHRNCAQDGNTCFSRHLKNSKLNILLLLF